MDLSGCLTGVELDRLLAEDVPYGDLTTFSLAQMSGWRHRGLMTMSARQDMRVCGTEEARQLLEHVGATAQVHAQSGAAVAPGAVLLSAQGNSQALLAGWKLAQTLIEWASGVASAVTQLIESVAIANTRTVIACTRKTAPFTRQLSVKAVRAGGGSMHRLNLSDSLLLFPEHLQFFDGATQTIDCAQRLRQANPERTLVAEVLNVEQACSLAAYVQVLQLEKFSPEDVARVATYLRHNALTTVLAAAGGIHADNAADYATAGAQVLVTSWPYQARPKDVQVKFACQ